MAYTKQLLYGSFRKCGLRHQSSVSNVEVRIPVPWGYLAGKFWGPHDKKPILTLHGWLDNCDSFDNLIPLLPKHLSYLCIDLPGHGHSSKIPEGLFYHDIEGVLMIRRIQEYFKWKTLSLMGHCLGAITAYSYGFLHPENVDFIVCIDGFQPFINRKKLEGIREAMENFLKYDKQNSDTAEPPSYTIQEIVNKLHMFTRKSIDLDKCEYLLKRNISPSENHPGKYYIRRDARLKGNTLMNWNPEDLYAAARRVDFPLFISKADKSSYYSNKLYYDIALDHLMKTNKDFEWHKVEGNHYEHYNAPETLAELITQFILKHDKVDRSVMCKINEIKA